MTDYPGARCHERDGSIERLDLWGPKAVAVYPRAEHARLLGMAAKKSADWVLVGARGFNPVGAKRVVVVPAPVFLALAV